MVRKFMDSRKERLPPGWWIVEAKTDRYGDGPFSTPSDALERYNRLPGRLRQMRPFGLNPTRTR